MCGGGAEKPGTAQPGEVKARGASHQCVQVHLQGGWKKDGARTFSVVPRGVVGPPPLDILKSCLDMVLGYHLGGPI